FTGRLIPDAEELARVNAFDWQREFPAAMKAGGFDCIIGNPPYDVLEKERGGASWPHSALADYVRANADYTQGIGGKLNLFRFFIVRSKTLVRAGGRFGMIVPLAILGDISCAKTRRAFFDAFDGVEADCFPQKDNRKRRVFLDAKLSTVVLSASRCALHRRSRRMTVRTYPWNSFHDRNKECSIGLDDLRILDPENLPVPLVDQASWNLCRKLYAVEGTRRLGEIADYVVRRGEVNQTVYREFITTNSKHARLLKGVEIRRYGLNLYLHQGHREWFDHKHFLKDNSDWPVAQLRRIATQRITGVDDRLRVVATIMNPPCYFADSTNSIALSDSGAHTLEYMLALLNSRLFQWRFRLTSTNNNVGTNELECLPVVDADANNSRVSRAQARLSELATAMLCLHSTLSSAKSEAQRGTIQRQIDATDAEIDRLVYDLYGLTPEEIAIVEKEHAL
ncbi:MAG: Eco57I restriction-modification methylase domain-containing protein, partial [Chloroflexi bacterium]|nr:Eco57I restriction-modification methylase domain-containing protein [Chloroflexota bacterium]